MRRLGIFLIGASLSLCFTLGATGATKAYAEDKEKAAKLSKILYAQAALIAGQPLENPAEYSELVCSLF